MWRRAIGGSALAEGAGVVRKLAAAVLSAAALIAVVTPAANAADHESGAWFTISRTTAAAPSGGCVTLYSDAWDYVDEACQSSSEVLGFPNLEPGDYYAYFSGFDAGVRPTAAAVWWGGSPSVDSAETFTVPSGGAAELAVALPDGGYIKGVVDVTYGTSPTEGTIEVYDENLGFVTSSEFDGDPFFTIDQLPEGDYFLKFVNMVDLADQWSYDWYTRTGGNRSTVHVDTTYTGDRDTVFSIEANMTALIGTLRTPPS